MPPANHRLPHQQHHKRKPALQPVATGAPPRGLLWAVLVCGGCAHSVAILVGAKALMHNVTRYNILQHYEFEQILMHLKIFYIWSFMGMVKMRPVPDSSILTEDTP